MSIHLLKAALFPIDSLYMFSNLKKVDIMLAELSLTIYKEESPNTGIQINLKGLLGPEALRLYKS